ncbi:hypothetical protein ISF_04139 [Cordyceps fumosorosea ARSEF 2679]|uniref:Uncharacterized protein n=1 Tax=Cordyceps fumosorosea (strain ARSEF 2679) TaxID=1081104 RepID=A0A167YGM3_CORFA|nr:hypothetical protein ISF_04139 [Cordyceps fumosorosea ARSEF 2679]OAA66301.1 hypothetical protein ISF_04139 [Cordyceps fumosorosea ARSEF 2679]
MKFVAIIASLASIAVAADVSTTITCPDCKTPASTNDVVTRSPLPTTSCDSPSLTVVKTGGAQSTGGMSSSASGSQTGSPTGVPVTGGAGRVAGGALVAAVVAVAML